QMFAPKIDQNETVNSYIDLIYGPLIQDNILENAKDNDDSSSTSDDNDILTAGNQRHLKRAYQQFKQQIKYPRIKNFSFANSFDRVQQQTQAESLLRNLYTQLKQNSAIGKNVEEHVTNLNNISTEDIFAKI
ncbi:6848_t:CDS:2, partial [Cetraspora pellucida]